MNQLLQASVTSTDQRSIARLREPRRKTRDRLVMAHVGLVRMLARRLAQRLPPQIEVGELESAGVVGLIHAAGRYKASLGVPFDAFARRRVHGAMLDSLRDVDWAPRSVRRMRRAIDKAMTALRHHLGREPESLEIAAALKLSTDEYARVVERLRVADLVTIHQRSNAGNESSALDVTVDPSDDPHARLERLELREHLAKAIVELPQRERYVLALYYEKELTLAEIGEVIGVSESRVCQLRSQAIVRLRSKLRETLGTSS